MAVYDRPVVIQELDRDTEEWRDLMAAHASVNKARSQQYTDSGAMRTSQVLTFRMRWAEPMRRIPRDMQSFRVVYEGSAYRIEDTDDFMQRHLVFEVTAASYE